MEKWKVLLADDEPIIRQGIRGSIDWEQLQMEVVGEAEDGEEALEAALQLKTDIILVDLNMPIMNGITLIRELRVQLPDCRVIIVTGHEEFSYAQEAIRLNVDDYVLKPINVAQLTGVLTQVRKQLEERKQLHEHFEMANKQIAKNVTLLRERFCLEWLEGERNEQQLLEQLRFLKLPAAAPLTLGIIRWSETVLGRPVSSENDRQLFLFAIENIAGEIFGGHSHVIFRDRSGHIILFIWDIVAEDTVARLEGAITRFLKISTVQRFVGVDGVAGIPSAYQAAKQGVYQDNQMSPIVRRGKQMVQEQYSNPELSLELVAEHLQVSPVYFGRVFKQEMGMFFLSFLSQIRIKRAIQLLNATDLTIHDIAEQVGFLTQHYFSTSFKKQVGVSPNQYRRGGAGDGAAEEPERE